MQYIKSGHLQEAMNTLSKALSSVEDLQKDFLEEFETSIREFRFSDPEDFNENIQEIKGISETKGYLRRWIFSYYFKQLLRLEKTANKIKRLLTALKKSYVLLIFDDRRILIRRLRPNLIFSCEENFRLISFNSNHFINLKNHLNEFQNIKNKNPILY